MRKKVILLVDDEEIIRATLSRDLEEGGHEVMTAESGERAVALLKAHHVDLVITDLLMEGMDGIEVLRQVKAHDPETCVVILTGFGDLASAIGAVRYGADDYLLKPYQFDDLQLRINRCLAQQELRRRIKVYEEVLPICSVCRKIRDDCGKEHGSGDWLSLEEYFARRVGIKSSHSYCPACLKKAEKELLDR
ncbi:MAG: sigma-54-dependent transcriptional regulator [Thermodesulfobacteriota bacterium]